MNIDFSARRKALSDKVLEDSVIVLSSSSPKVRNSDADFPYRQDSSFFYLSGFSEPDSLLVIRPSAKENQFVMFCRDRDPVREQWDGFRAGQEGAVSEFGADIAYSYSDVNELMPKLMDGAKNVYYSMSSPNGIEAPLSDWIATIRANTRSGSVAPQNLLSLDLMLHEMRLKKSPDEIAIMKKAGSITTDAHIKAMESVRPGMYEYQLEAEYLHTFMQGGARHPAYNSIVGGGNNACILHYVENNSVLNDGDLVLVDAGCEYEHYASDVTRTFPVNGKFTEEQKSIYEVVLEAHRQSMAEVKPGNQWNSPHDKSVEVITDGLSDLGLLKGNNDYTKFYMHRVGHWLGMDVHDVGNYTVDGKWRDLEPGMVMTIEPGIYILDGLEGVDDKWQGIGIRVEDDVLVTEDGFEILTPDAPREVSDIEHLMNS